MTDNKQTIAKISWRAGDEFSTLKFCYGGYEGVVQGSEKDVKNCLALIMELQDRARAAEEAMREVKDFMDGVLSAT